jgi:hypothetical protein
MTDFSKFDHLPEVHRKFRLAADNLLDPNYRYKRAIQDVERLRLKYGIVRALNENMEIDSEQD